MMPWTSSRVKCALCLITVLACLLGCDDEPKKGSASKTALGYTVAIDSANPEVKTGNLTNRTRGEVVYKYCAVVVAPANGLGTVNLASYLTAASQAHLDKVNWFVGGTLNTGGATLTYADIDADMEIRECLVDVRDKVSGIQHDQIVIVIVSTATKNEFDTWYAGQKADMGWTAGLPKVYSSITIVGGAPQDPEPPASQRWQAPTTLDSHFHPGARYDMRSEKVDPGGHGHQACYKADGSIIASGVSGGTADRRHWSYLTGAESHVNADVKPFIRACQLDANAVIGNWINSDLNQPLMYEGASIGKYLEVRPALADANRQIAPGTPCP